MCSWQRKGSLECRRRAIAPSTACVVSRVGRERGFAISLRISLTPLTPCAPSLLSDELSSSVECWVLLRCTCHMCLHAIIVSRLSCRLCRRGVSSAAKLGERSELSREAWQAERARPRNALGKRTAERAQRRTPPTTHTSAAHGGEAKSAWPKALVWNMWNVPNVRSRRRRRSSLSVPVYQTPSLACMRKIRWCNILVT